MLQSTSPRFRPVLAFLLGFLCLLAYAAPARAVNDDPILKRMDATLAENARLRLNLRTARRRGGPAVRKAAAALAASDARVEEARVQAMAHVAGVSPAQVRALRAGGLSWGRTSERFGVHPCFLGIDTIPPAEPTRVRRGRKVRKSRRLARRKRLRGRSGRKAALRRDRPAKVRRSGAGKVRRGSLAKVRQKRPAKIRRTRRGRARRRR